MITNQIDTKGLYDKVIAEIRADVDTLPFTPSYTCYLIGNDPASERYVGLKHKTSNEAGVECIVKRVTEQEFYNEMSEIEQNHRSYRDRHRAMLQLPAPEGCIKVFNNMVWMGYIADVDHLGDDVHLDMWKGKFDRVPGTPRGVVAVLCEELGSLSGKNIAVIGSRSKTTGRFLVPMLQHLNATVGMFHSRSVIREGEFEKYDAVISAVGKAGFINASHLGENKKVLIDVGVDFVDGKVRGDFSCDVRNVHRYTPYVAGVGLLTRAFLVVNVVESYLNRR